MATKDGYLDFKRKDINYRDVSERVQDFEEIIVPNEELELKRQAARCMGCDIPFCFALGCPVQNHIPEINDSILRKDYKAAYEKLTIKNPFPEITGRICPALCEYSCSLSITMEPVTIKQLELYAIEKAFQMGLVNIPLKEKNGKTVGIIGSGPAGLAAANELTAQGFQVTVYEKKEKPGGLLRYGIPNYKLPKNVVDRRIKVLKDAGVKFLTSTEVGKDITLDEVRDNHDVVLISMGSGQPRDLNIPGRDTKGVHLALEFLGQYNHLEGESKINASDKDVLVIGGGDTGSDCIGTARRQGAINITQIEIMPQPYQWDGKHNPEWPNYPRYNRVSSSHKEGCVRDFNVNTKYFVHRDGKLKGAMCSRVEWVKKEDGSMNMEEIKGSEFFIKAELILIAMGFLHLEHLPMLEELGIEYDRRGNITEASVADLKGKGIFVCGDALSGASLVVRSINSGLRAAEDIVSYLLG
jgi:glutamate synthase (NADPH/NADH) small chain